jgi:hypothetical protein
MNTKKEVPKAYMRDSKAFRDASAKEYNEAEDDDIESLLSSDGNNSDTAVLKELFSNKNIKVKSELSDYEISIISRLFILSKLTNRPLLKDVVMEFIELRASKDRKSRAEFVDAHKERKRVEGNNLLQSLGLGGGNQG